MSALSEAALSFMAGSVPARAPGLSDAHHPGDIAALIHAREFVLAARARRVSWQNIAKQLGRNEISLRKLYDPDYREPGDTAPRLVVVNEPVFARSPPGHAELPTLNSLIDALAAECREAAHG